MKSLKEFVEMLNEETEELIEAVKTSEQTGETLSSEADIQAWLARMQDDSE